MKHKKWVAALLAGAFAAGISLPAFATGYSSNTDWYNYYYGRLPYTWSWYRYRPGSSSSGGTDRRDTDRPRTGWTPNTPGTTIPDSQVPLGSGTALLRPNATAPLTASQLTKNANGHYVVENVSTVDPGVVSNLYTVINSNVRINGFLVGRWYVETAQVAKANKTINLALSVDPADTANTQNRFTRHFGGTYRVVSLAQKDSFGSTVRLAVHVNTLSGLDLSKLKVLVYNKSTNSFAKVNPADIAFKDKYVYINLIKGGELVFTDSSRF